MVDQNGNRARPTRTSSIPTAAAAADSGRSQGFQQEDGMTTLKDGNTTLQFGHRQSFDQRYDPDHLFDPLGGPPGVR